MSDLILNVAGKVVVASPDGKVLILRESSRHATNTKPGHYQLPGGRLEPGEAFFDGLRREVMEETGLMIEIGQAIMVGEWRPVIKGVPHQIIGMFLTAKTDGTAVRLSEEHDDYQWINPHKVSEYDIMAPDNAAIDTYAAMIST